MPAYVFDDQLRLLKLPRCRCMYPKQLYMRCDKDTNHCTGHGRERNNFKFRPGNDGYEKAIDNN
jgi:hypothetical protein